MDLAGNVLCRVLAQKTNDGAMQIFRLGIKQQEWRSFGRQGPQASAAEDLHPKVSYLTFLLEFHVLCIVLKYSKTDSATSPMTEKTLAPLRPKGWRSTYPTCSKTISCVQVRSRLNVKLHFLVKKATNSRSQKKQQCFFGNFGKITGEREPKFCTVSYRSMSSISTHLLLRASNFL